MKQSKSQNLNLLLFSYYSSSFYLLFLLLVSRFFLFLFSFFVFSFYHSSFSPVNYQRKFHPHNSSNVMLLSSSSLSTTVAPHLITVKTVYGLLPLADEYQIPELRQKCLECMLSMEGSIQHLVIAQTYNFKTLLTHCVKWAGRSLRLSALEKSQCYSLVDTENLLKIHKARIRFLEGNCDSCRSYAHHCDIGKH